MSADPTREETDALLGAGTYDAKKATTAAQATAAAQAAALDTTSARAQFARGLDEFRKALDDVRAKSDALKPFAGLVPVAGPFLVLAAQGIDIAATATDAIDDALEPVGL